MISRRIAYIACSVCVAPLLGCGNGAPPSRDLSVAHAEPAVAAGPVVAADESGVAPQTSSSPSDVVASTQNTSSAEDPLQQIRKQLEEVSQQATERTVAPAHVETSGAVAPPPKDTAVELQRLHEDVEELRTEVKRLQETVDAALAYLVGELHEENRRLKTDLAMSDEPGSPAVDDSVPQTDGSMAPEPEAVPDGPAAPPIDYGELGYLVVKEWGRTPEQAQELETSKPGTEVTSLRGMICAVPPGLSEDAIKAIGKRLRADSAEYDNLNIEVFDDEAAARDYAERNVLAVEHRVMNIIRHKATGRDATIVIRDNGAREVVVD